MSGRATVANTLDQRYLAEIRDGVEALGIEMRRFYDLLRESHRQTLEWRDEAQRLRLQIEGCPVCGHPVPGPSWREPVRTAESDEHT